MQGNGSCKMKAEVTILLKDLKAGRGYYETALPSKIIQALKFHPAISVSVP